MNIRLSYILMSIIFFVKIIICHYHFSYLYNPQNEMLPFHKTKCSETQNEASSL